MKIALRVIAGLLAVGCWAMYIVTALNTGGPMGWMNSWQVPTFVVTGLLIATFVLTLTRAGTRGSVLTNLGTALHQPKLVDPVEGIAQVVTASGQPRSGQNMGSAMCEMNLVITIADQPSVAVNTASIVKLAQWPTAGVQLPVLAERSDPTQFRILWDQVGTGWSVGMQQAQALAASFNAKPHGAPDAGAAGLPGVPGVPPGATVVSSSVTINGKQASADEIAAMETLTDMDLNADGVIGQNPDA